MELRVSIPPADGWDGIKVYSDAARLKSASVRPDGSEYLVSESKPRLNHVLKFGLSRRAFGGRIFDRSAEAILKLVNRVRS